ncbi:HDIG domain-containing metalloprotein [Limnochorda pilosa]|uniref:Metal dependent phosphohydrolase n=1 Tax=Limnochorda pilosa TaxID=1555112 RepID=A0A0K2SJI4_LIMPI|nr:HDIG domain-containing metalloprotein [Limnochorda pilosa]BAS27019.1 metal dependent phosphohydrolase [Limnochorda pilosa]
MPHPDGLPESREDAIELLRTYTESPQLVKHALAVEAALAAYAGHFHAPGELWARTGLLHDLDYERWPEEHPHRGVALLAERGYPEAVLHAIRAHADGTVPRESLLDRALFAVDELTGFLAAVALVRPDRRIDQVTFGSVRKKMKDKSFARGVDREDLERSAQELGVPFQEHVERVIGAMRGIASELELDGRAASGR